MTKKLLLIAPLGLAGFLAAVVLVINQVKEQSLADCNNGKIEACADIATTDAKTRITNKEYLAAEAAKAEAKAKADAEKARLAEEAKAAEAEAKAKAKAERARLAAEAKAEAKRKAEEIAARGEWNYSTYTDDATGKPYKVARLTSKNTVNFDFPYSGNQNGYFSIRNHPRYGFDAFLSVRKGQLLCGTYSNTTVLIRFDNGPAVAYGCNEPADNSSETIFIEGVGRLEAAMRGKKKMYVTVTVYQEGSQTFEFNVTNYEPSRI